MAANLSWNATPSLFLCSIIAEAVHAHCKNIKRWLLTKVSCCGLVPLPSLSDPEQPMSVVSVSGNCLHCGRDIAAASLKVVGGPLPSPGPMGCGHVGGTPSPTTEAGNRAGCYCMAGVPSVLGCAPMQTPPSIPTWGSANSLFAQLPLSFFWLAAILHFMTCLTFQKSKSATMQQRLELSLQQL